MEKVHERLKDEIQYEQIEKNKLSRYKDQNVKRLHHLEQQAKQTEMVASVNIDKILNQVGQNNKQIEQLKIDANEKAEYMAQLHKARNQEVKKIRDTAEKESKVKVAALSKVANLRQEI